LYSSSIALALDYYNCYVLYELLRAMNGFALTVDRAALLDDGLVASQSTGRATVE